MDANFVRAKHAANQLGGGPAAAGLRLWRNCNIACHKAGCILCGCKQGFDFLPQLRVTVTGFSHESRPLFSLLL